MSEAAPAQLDNLTDEELCRLCQAGSDAAERVLLRRYMPAIYWLPRQMFGAAEEDLSAFLLFALEKIRERDIIAKFDTSRRSRFATWFGVVLQRLYLDFLRQESRSKPPPAGDRDLESMAARQPEAADKENAERAEALLAQMHVRCRALFKLLLCHTLALAPDEIRWIAATSAKSIWEVMAEIAQLEERLRNAEAEVNALYERLAAAWWWKQQCENRRYAGGCRGKDAAAEDARLERYRRQYRRLVAELTASARTVSAPYRELANLLKMNEGTLASHISRCRASALTLWRQQYPCLLYTSPSPR
ncbi:MAG: sigma-70 family RNA polymerase sigma factor, partial [Planctomycetota bacterium]|nr:sigma-70 family RNA polymerase sigma factor [Planctomycetota bacterium]